MRLRQGALRIWPPPKRPIRVPPRAGFDWELPYAPELRIEEVVTRESPLFVACPRVDGALVLIDSLVRGQNMEGMRGFELDPPLTKVGCWTSRGPSAAGAADPIAEPSGRVARGHQTEVSQQAGLRHQAHLGLDGSRGH